MSCQDVQRKKITNRRQRMKKENLLKIKEELLADIEHLVNIPSIPDESTISKDAPFGKPIRKCFDAFRKIAENKGFLVEDDEGYAITATIGKGDEYVGILGHLDVVGVGNTSLWNSDPFKMSQEDGMLYGRGVNDDKGPLLAAFYAAWLLKQQNLPLRYAIKIIAGGAEETTWECMDHYFKSHKQPILGFSPDGNFPIVNGEKGILQFRFIFPKVHDITIISSERLNYVCDQLDVILSNGLQKQYIGKRALSRNPQSGGNAIFSLLHDKEILDSCPSIASCISMIKEQFMDDFFGEKCGIYSEDEQMGTTSICPMSLTCNTSVFELCMDIRYGKSTRFKTIWNIMEKIANQYGAKLECIKHKELLYVDENSDLIQGLKKAYFNVMKEEAQVLTKGGASYARVLENGVAFGATFENEDPKPHMPNECMSIDSLLKACEIYYEALYELVVEK